MESKQKKTKFLEFILFFLISFLKNRKIVESKYVQNLLGLLNTCGSIEFSSDWKNEIGLLAKTSNTGVILLVVPGVFGMCVYSPKVDQRGISARGFEFCQKLVKQFPQLKNKYH